MTTYQVNILPWVSVGPLALGQVRLFPFNSEDMSWVENEAKRSHLDEYLGRFFKYDLSPVDAMTICAYGDDPLRPLEEEELEGIRQVVAAIAFATIAPGVQMAVTRNNSSFGPPSTDAYELRYAKLDTGEYFTATSEGSNVLADDFRNFYFVRPLATGGFADTPSYNMVERFKVVLDTAFSPDVRERILRSLEWFALAHTGRANVSLKSKVVMMATAFEILTQTPNKPGKGEWLAQTLDEWAEHLEPSKETKPDGQGGEISHSAVGWWMRDYFRMRNAIVHGDVVSEDRLRAGIPGKEWVHHLIIADLVFLECVRHECVVNGAFDPTEKLWNTEAPEVSYEHLCPGLFREVFESLLWPMAT